MSAPLNEDYALLNPFITNWCK